MNDRIKKLKEQATSYTWNGVDVTEELDESMFAKLIIKECAKIAKANPCPYQDPEQRKMLGHTWDMASVEAGNEILKHFGCQK